MAMMDACRWAQTWFEPLLSPTIATTHLARSCMLARLHEESRDKKTEHERMSQKPTMTENSEVVCNIDSNKRQRTSTFPFTANDLPSTAWCQIADFLPHKTSRALLAVALTAPPASFRDSGWKGQPNAVSKAIISSTKSGASFEVILKELWAPYPDRGDETELEKAWRMRNRLYDVARTSEQKEVEKEIRKRFRYGHGGYGSFKFAANSAKLQLKENFDVKWEILDLADIDSSLSAKLTDDDIGAVFVCIDAKNHLKRFKLRNNSNFVGYGLEPLRDSTLLEKLDLGLTRVMNAFNQVIF